MNSKRPQHPKVKNYKDYLLENPTQAKQSSYLPMTDTEWKKLREKQMIEKLKKNLPYLKGDTVSLS